MIKSKLVVVAILSSSAIASTLMLSSASSAHPCWRYKNNSYQKYEQADLFRSPWTVVLTFPGIALAAALSVGDRIYKKDS